jgi:hypothetical protein
MSCTALRITKEDGSIVRIKFLTVQVPDKVDVDIYNCNEEFMPIGNPHMTQVDGSEEEYHKKLRREAFEKGHFVPEESTDHNWNPDYVEPETTSDEIKDNPQLGCNSFSSDDTISKDCI